MKKNVSNVNIRKSNEKVTQKRAKYSVSPTVQYNGSCESYEDPADYVRLPIKAVRLA